MWTRSRRETVLWLAAAGYTGAIYATLGLMPNFTELLRRHNLLRAGVAAAFLLTVAVAVVWLWRRRPGWREWGVLAAAGAGYGAVLPFALRPEEQIHLIEYGVLGLLLYTALLERRRTRLDGGAAAGSLGAALRRPAVTALLTATALGFIDEGIQEILPQRYYDLRDVAFNLLAAGLAIAAAAGLAWARRRRPTGPDPGAA